MRRFAGLVVALLALVVAGGPIVAAQDATPATGTSPLAAMGYPELRVRVTDTGVEAPSTAPAGLTLLTLENASKEGTSVFLLQPPAGTTMAELRATVQAEATPGSGEEEEFPAWFYDAVLTGGPSSGPGESAQVLIDVAPGEWAIATEGSQEPAMLTVTGEGATPTAAGEPPADVTVEMQEFAFVGLDDGVPAGPQTWKITNTGKQPHILVLIKSPVTITMDQVMTLLQLPENATPPAGVPDPETFEDVNGLTVLSTGRTAWLPLDLTPGTYVALCFIPDKETHAPHAAMGMVSIFTVGEGGTPTT